MNMFKFTRLRPILGLRLRELLHLYSTWRALGEPSPHINNELIQRIYNTYQSFSTPKYFLQVNKPPTDSTMLIFKLIQSYLVTYSNKLVMICSVMYRILSNLLYCSPAFLWHSRLFPTISVCSMTIPIRSVSLRCLWFVPCFSAYFRLPLCFDLFSFSFSY